MATKVKIGRIVVILLLILISGQGMSAPVHKTTDLRILIDVSGSMKKNDPHNLRIPAIRLISGLLPYKIKAGIWIFSGKTKRLVALSKVTKKWKRIALKRSTRIHSRGRYTNIEAALRTVSLGWNNKSKHYNRHLIILTDGMIDISKSAEKNNKSRYRIYKLLIPALKKAGVKVHTIALSDNADHSLLRSLSAQTNGWYNRINNTNSLHRIFLKLFENSTKTDKVPITANRFKIDKSVQDMTVLVFRQSNSKPGALLTPSGKRWTAKSHPPSIKWMHEDNFELVTVNKPEAGQWGIVSKLDPDNRVMIVTNLKLNHTRLPQALIKGEQLTLNAHLSQKNKPIRKKRFMRLVKFYAEGKPEFSDRMYLHDDGQGSDAQAGDGHYSLRINSFHQANQTYSITLTAKSATFERVSQQNVRIYKNAFTINATKLEQEKTSLITARLNPGLFIPDSAQLSVIYPDGSTTILKKELDGSYQLKANGKFNGQEVQIKIVGMRTNNKNYSTQLAQLLPGFKKPGIKQAPKVHAPLKATPTPHHKHTEDSTHKDEHQKPKEKKKRKKKKHKNKKHKKKAERMISTVSWSVVVPSVLVGNILLIGGGIMLRRKKKGIELNTNGDSPDE